MSVSNIIELLVLLCSIAAVTRTTKRSNQAVEDLDGLGNVTRKKEEKGIVVAHF